MANYLQIQINNSTGIASGTELYLYIIGYVEGSYYSYYLSADGNYVATQHNDNTVTPIPLSSLPFVSNNPNVSYFNFDQGEPFSSGRIWFSTSNTLLSITSGQVTQPNPSGGLLFDFIELTIKAGQNVNCDTTQVVGLGIPITIINPTVLTFPPTGGDYSNYTFPNAVGIVPGNSLSSICENFTNYVKAIGLSEFASCVQNYPTGQPLSTVQWLMNPGFQVPLYVPGTKPAGLGTCLDSMLLAFFTYFSQPGNTLTITFESVVYTGAVVTQAGLDPANSTQEYSALVFTDPNSNTYPIFYPYFNTNSASTQGGPLNPNNTLPPPPSWWSTNNLPTTMPASGQVLLCEGVFNDSNPNSKSPTILAALQNIVVTMLNRGLIPGETMNNLFACTGNLTLVAKPVIIQDQNPANSTTIQGAALLYAPSQIPTDTDASTCMVSGSIQLPGGNSDGSTLIQTFSNNVVTLPPTPYPNNYCTSPVITQLNTSQDVQFVFPYLNAVWPDKKTPASLISPVTIEYTPTEIYASTATFTPIPSDSITGIRAGMNVFDLNVQNPSTILAVGEESFTIQSSINGILPSPNTDTLIIGNFFPTSGGNAMGCWNAYAAFLHYGGNGTPAPYISNQGYAFAYDDDGGYSSDITVNFPTTGENCALGIYLGPLKNTAQPYIISFDEKKKELMIQFGENGTPQPFNNSVIDVHPGGTIIWDKGEHIEGMENRPDLMPLEIFSSLIPSPEGPYWTSLVGVIKDNAMQGEFPYGMVAVIDPPKDPVRGNAIIRVIAITLPE